MKQSDITELLSKLDGRGSDDEYNAIKALTTLGDALPSILLEQYRVSSKYGERASCVYHAIKYAKSNSDAFELGLEATKDKSKKVRYRAFMLLAVSQNDTALPHLKSLISDSETGEDAKAAIDSIENKNQHYFVDREHSGKVVLNVS